MMRQAMMRQGDRIALFLGAFAGFTALAVWVADHGYRNAASLRMWADVIMSWSAEQFAEDRLSILYPQLRFYLALLYYRVVPSADGAALALLAALVGAGVTVMWFAWLRRSNWPAPSALAATAIVATHPFMLWAVTRGTGDAFGLLGFTLLVLALGRTHATGRVRALINLASVLAAYFVLDERFAYLLIALIPLLPFHAPPAMLVRAPASIFLVMLTPLAATILAYLYLSWVFVGDALSFTRDPASLFHGAWLQAETMSWLRHYGGLFLAPLAIGVMLAALATPLPLLAAARTMTGRWDAPRQDAPQRDSPVSMIAITGIVAPLIALATATLTRFAAHPAEFLLLLLPVTVLALAGCATAAGRWAAIGLVAVGHLGGWLALGQWQGPDLARWTTALAGQHPADPFAPEHALADWLDENPGTMRGTMPGTMIDDRLAYPAIVALGTASALVLPQSAGFKLATLTRTPMAGQIAVPDPERPHGREDKINQNFPDLYAEGLAGYRLAYDQLGWRVYRRAVTQATARTVPGHPSSSVSSPP